MRRPYNNNNILLFQKVKRLIKREIRLYLEHDQNE